MTSQCWPCKGLKTSFTPAQACCSIFCASKLRWSIRAAHPRFTVITRKTTICLPFKPWTIARKSLYIPLSLKCFTKALWTCKSLKEQIISKSIKNNTKTRFLLRNKRVAIFVCQHNPYLIPRTSPSQENARTALWRIQPCCCPRGSSAILALTTIKTICTDAIMTKFRWKMSEKQEDFKVTNRSK